MRRNHGHIFCLAVCILTLSVPVCSQIKKAAPSIAVIDTDAFYNESSGIKVLLDALRPLDKEIKPFTEDLTTHLNKYNELIKQARDFQAHPIGACLDPTEFQKILDDISNAEALIRGKQAKAKEFYERPRNELIKPIAPKIAEALREFAASRGYALVVEKSQLTSPAIIIEDPDNHLMDITTDFIKFFNEKYLSRQN